MRLALTPIAAAVMGSRRPTLDQQIAAIYAAGWLGPWFDTSDLSTMYTTRTGSTLVGTPGDGTAHFVGRMEDKSLGRVLGAELGNPALLDKRPATDGTVSRSGGVITFTNAASGLSIGVSQEVTGLTVGKTYLFAGRARVVSGSLGVIAIHTASGGGGSLLSSLVSLSGTMSDYTIQWTATQTTAHLTYRAANGSVIEVVEANHSFRELPGYHALAANDTTARPQLSARVNGLLRTEDFSHAAWSNANITVTSGQTDVFGGTRAARLEATSTGITSFNQVMTGVGSVGGNIARLYVKQSSGAIDLNRFLVRDDTATTNIVAVALNFSTGAITYITGSTGVTMTAADDGWWLLTITASAVANGNNMRLYLGATAGTDTAGESVLVCFPDFRSANIHAAGSIPAYQRVTAAEDYDSAGFPFRLIPNGTGQSMATNVITPGTDSVTVGVGIRKLSDATAIVAEFSPDSSATNGSMAVYTFSTGDYRANSRGTAVRTATSAVIAAPDTATVLVSADVSTPDVGMALDNGARTSNVNSQGTGNYEAHAMNLFARSSASSPSLFFGGQYFGSITLFGPQLSAPQIATVESWLNSKTKAY